MLIFNGDLLNCLGRLVHSNIPIFRPVYPFDSRHLPAWRHGWH